MASKLHGERGLSWEMKSQATATLCSMFPLPYISKQGSVNAALLAALTMPLHYGSDPITIEVNENLSVHFNRNWIRPFVVPIRRVTVLSVRQPAAAQIGTSSVLTVENSLCI